MTRRLFLFGLLCAIGSTPGRCQDTGIIRPADPPDPDLRQQMVGWRSFYFEQMAPVRRQWSRVVTAIHDGRVTDLPLVCPDFRDRLHRLDRRRLLAVADPTVRTWLGRGLSLLDDAGDQCYRHRYFALGFRLYKARHVFQTIDRRVQSY